MNGRVVGALRAIYYDWSALDSVKVGIATGGYICYNYILYGTSYKKRRERGERKCHSSL